MLHQDGRSASLTAPNGPAQEELVARVLSQDNRVRSCRSGKLEADVASTSLEEPVKLRP